MGQKKNIIWIFTASSHKWNAHRHRPHSRSTWSSRLEIMIFIRVCSTNKYDLNSNMILIDPRYDLHNSFFFDVCFIESTVSLFPKHLLNLCVGDRINSSVHHFPASVVAFKKLHLQFCINSANVLTFKELHQHQFCKCGYLSKIASASILQVWLPSNLQVLVFLTCHIPIEPTSINDLNVLDSVVRGEAK